MKTIARSIPHRQPPPRPDDREERAERVLARAHLLPIPLASPRDVIVLREGADPVVVPAGERWRLGQIGGQALVDAVASAGVPPGQAIGVVVLATGEVAVTEIALRPCAAPGDA